MTIVIVLQYFCMTESIFNCELLCTVIFCHFHFLVNINNVESVVVMCLFSFLVLTCKRVDSGPITDASMPLFTG